MHVSRVFPPPSSSRTSVAERKGERRPAQQTITLLVETSYFDAAIEMRNQEVVNSQTPKKLYIPLYSLS